MIKFPVSTANMDLFCKTAVELRILCVRGDLASGDFTLSQTNDGELLLTAGQTTVEWPLGSSRIMQAWKDFSAIAMEFLGEK